MSFRIFSAALWAVSVLFVCGLVLAVFFYNFDLAQLPLLGTMLSRPHLMDRVTPILILLLGAWVLVELARRYLRIRREFAAVDKFQTTFAEADRNLYQPKTFSLAEPRAARRVDLIVECSRRDPSSLHDAVPAAASLDAGTLAASYLPLNVYAWILPVLGFIGTASGMASSIGGFKDALKGGQGQGQQVDALASQLSQSVIPGLSSAFETTILALGAALVAYLCTSALRGWDQEALDQLDRLCIVLLSRIPQPEGPEGKRIVEALGQISEQLRGIVQVPLAIENAARDIGAAAAQLAAAGQQSEASSTAFRSAIEELIAVNRASATAADQIGSAAQALAEASRKMDEAASEPFNVVITRGSRP